LELFEVMSADMIGKFRVPRMGGAIFSHDFVERKRKIRFAYPVRSADADTFLLVFRQLITFIGRKPKILRVDMGSNYMSDEVKKFCTLMEIDLQSAVVAAPHQIAQDERNHGVLLSTMRAIMLFSRAYYPLWALALKYSCILNNHMATDYTDDEKAFIPWQSVIKSLDVKQLYIFGCLIIMHASKEQVEDGKLDPRGVPAVFVGWGIQEGKKAIACYTEQLYKGENVHYVCFYAVDETYFPMRPAGQRRLLADGTFGSEGETAGVFDNTTQNYDSGEFMPEPYVSSLTTPTEPTTSIPTPTEPTTSIPTPTEPTTSIPTEPTTSIPSATKDGKMPGTAGSNPYPSTPTSSEDSVQMKVVSREMQEKR
jgi:hypothetical protein